MQAVQANLSASSPATELAGIHPACRSQETNRNHQYLQVKFEKLNSEVQFVFRSPNGLNYQHYEKDKRII